MPQIQDIDVMADLDRIERAIEKLTSDPKMVVGRQAIRVIKQTFNAATGSYHHQIEFAVIRNVTNPSGMNWFYGAVSLSTNRFDSSPLFSKDIMFVARTIEALERYQQNSVEMAPYICKLCRWELLIDVVGLDGKKQYQCELCDHITVIDD